MTEHFIPFDPAELLTSTEAIDAFMADAIQTADPAHIAAAREVVRRARAHAVRLRRENGAADARGPATRVPKSA